MGLNVRIRKGGQELVPVKPQVVSKPVVAKKRPVATSKKAPSKK